MDSRYAYGLMFAAFLAGCGEGGRYADVVVEQAESAARANTYPLLETDPTASWSHNEAFCEGQSQPDTAIIPTDPRHSVLPGISEGRAVAFNEYWEDCHQNIEVKRSQTCGEYRDRKERGRIQATKATANGLFGPANTTFELSQAGVNRLWQTWGLQSRPDNFEEMMRQRYGLPKANFHNPYPLADEDPKTTNGGSGQLPLGLVQRQDADGNYTGTITMTCVTCHSAQVGTQQDGADLGGIVGLAPQNLDLHVMLADFIAADMGSIPSSVIPLPLDLSARRGGINAAGFSAIALSIIDLDILRLNSPVPRFNLLAQSTGNTKTIGWSHTLHRMRSFFDGVHGIDNHRMNSVAFGAIGQITGAQAGVEFDMLANEEMYVETVAEFMNSTRPPRFPASIDKPLAEAGAILFHSKDLWAAGKLDDIPKPPSNGSCAGCHGVYSPRYAHDPEFLADPSLKGVVGYLSPLDEIGVDRARAENFTSEIRYGLTSSWIGYPEGVDGWVDPASKSPLQELADDYQPMEQRPQGVCTWHQEFGYNTPSLYGVWANGPYLHNGSVPTMWDLLKPEERPAVWRRQLMAEGVGDERGYETDLTAYDFQKMGWKYDRIYCGSVEIPYNDCEPEQALPEPLEGLIEFLIGAPANLPTSGLGGTGLDQLMPTARASIERRKIFNSHEFGAGNQGHDYGRALTDVERKAVIEYLKTL